MRQIVPTFMVDADDPVTVQHHASGRCALRVGDGSLIFDSAAEAEAAVDEWALALRLAHVGGVADAMQTAIRYPSSAAERVLP